MNLEERIAVLNLLNEYILADLSPFKAIKEKAFEKNKWFTEEFVNLALKNISTEFLDTGKLKAWINHYHIDDNISPKQIGVVMAGNIPLVGFHDFLCVFITGHHQQIKLSEKDEILFTHIIEKMCEWNSEVADLIKVSSMLKDCDAYIATGSNNSVRYFNFYFGKYPSIIRNNKTSVAVLTGNETPKNLFPSPMMYIFILALDAEMLPKYLFQKSMILFRCSPLLNNTISLLIILNIKIIMITILRCLS